MICFVGKGSVGGIIVAMFGVRLLIVLSGYFGWNIIVTLLKVWRDLWLIFRPFSCVFLLH